MKDLAIRRLSCSMARILTFAAVLFCMACNVFAKGDRRDDEGHLLVMEWKEYREAEEKDLPRTQEKVLKDIIDKAGNRRLSWDFYDAVKKYRDVVRSRDWKRYQAVTDSLRTAVAGYGYPVVTWNLSDSYPVFVEAPGIREISENEELKSSRNDQFYRNDRFIRGGGLPEMIVSGIGNDYEYLIWSMFMRSTVYRPVGDRDSLWNFKAVSGMLEDWYNGRYPESAYVEYVRAAKIPADSISARRDALEAFALKYRDRGIRLFAEQELIRMKFNALQKASGTSDDYAALRKECEDFEKTRKSMKEEASLVGACTYPSELAGILDSRGIRARIIDDTDTLRIELRNLRNVGIRIENVDSAVVFERVLDNPAGSYFVADTLDLILPAMDDGKYRIFCSSGDTEASFNYERYTLSMAWQWQDRGLALYLADFMSGKPVGKADIDIYYRDSLVRHVDSMAFDGFTLIGADLPEEYGRFYIRCSCTDKDGILRQTDRRYIYDRKSYGQTLPSPGTMSCTLITDRAAFNPGDTLKFKAVVYETWQDDSSNRSRTKYRVWTGQEPLVAELIDASKKTVATDTLTVNDFGSASGSFLLPEDSMNGWFTLCMKSGGRTLASTAVTVDEFVLPTFTASFEPLDEIYFPGDTVTVRGRLKSYAGRSLAAADVTYSVSLWNELQQEGRLDIAPDGTFSFDFVAGNGGDGDYFHHNITVKVVDATGETHEFAEGVVIGDFYLDVEIENEAEASIMNPEGWDREAETDSAGTYGVKALDGSFAVVSFNIRNAGYEPVSGKKVMYSLYRRDSLMVSGETVSGTKIWLDLSSQPSGTYRLRASSVVDGREKTCVCDLVKTADGDKSLDTRYENFFKVLHSDDIRLQFGASAGPVWAVVQLFGDKGVCLESETVYLAGTAGEKGSLVTLGYEYKDTYPDVVRLHVVYFRNGKSYSYGHDFERKGEDMLLPLVFSRFTDTAFPGGTCYYEIRTLPGAECAVSVFDVTTETVRPNMWHRVLPYSVSPYVSGSYCTGSISGRGNSPLFRSASGEMVPFQLTGKAPMFGVAASESRSNVMDAVQNQVMTKSSDRALADVSVRENFSDVLAFYPFLRSDENGTVSFSFTAGDKLSEYYVSLFAHDKSMNNNVLRRTMSVSLPVTVTVMEPEYLYCGDVYDLQVALSNVSESDVEGVLSVHLYDGGDYRSLVPFMAMSRPESVKKGNASESVFSMDVPENIDTLGIKVTYRTSGGASDGIFVTVPVSDPVQTLYESHSALLLPGMSRDSLVRKLTDEFVNVSGYGAVSREISIAGMLAEAIPESVEQKSPDVISAVSSCLASYLTHRIKRETGSCLDCDTLAREILSYQNAGGGFAWLKGGGSSPLVTAVVLEYIAVMRKEGFADDGSVLAAAAVKAVEYLDSYYFKEEKLSIWAGDINIGQYLYIRSFYNSIPLSVGISRKTGKTFAGQVRDYLYDRDTLYPSGHILYKARRAITILNFLTSGEEGFAGSAGLRFNRKLASCLDRYMESLKEYAVDHVSGGKYYPNAVLPFRGLLENELYAHSVLCRLLEDYGEYRGDSASAGIADGIRLWIMIQKETQAWDDDPACLLALDAVMRGSDELLSAKVLVLTQKYRKPFEDIQAAGNDISVKARYFVEDGSAGNGDAVYAGYRELAEGDTLNVGDKVLAVYELWSAENRSFVRLTAPRYSSLRPEKQLSGHYGLQVRPGSGAYVTGYFRPYSYREVKSDRSIWYIDVLPEENTKISETLIVTQSGRFSSAVSDIECMYAPHYRANDGCHPQLVSEK